ncbi:MAG: hypothetical protein U0X92_08950 [Anaerolineales bacterium]
MFDNLRESASDSSFYEEESNELYREPAAKSSAAPSRRRETRFLGLTGQQRFLLSVMLFLTVCAFGTLAMFVLGKMSLF